MQVLTRKRIGDKGMIRQRLLLIEPHSDDGAISVGGFLEKYRHVYDYHFLLVLASDMPLHHSARQTRSERLDEFQAYVKHHEGTWIRPSIGAEQLPLDQDAKLDLYPRRQLVALIEQAIELVHPDILMVTGPSFHHDHTAVYEATIAALRPTARFMPREVYVLENPTYMHASNPLVRFHPDTYVALTEEELDAKIDAFLGCFPSQIRDDQNYLSAAGIRSWARYRGMEARSLYAEALHTFSRRL